MINLPIKLLKRVSIWYLVLPVLILFGTWFKPIYGIPLCLLFLFSYITFEKENRFNKSSLKVSTLNIVLVTIGVLLWTALSGSGGIGFQNHDLAKANSLIKDIAELNAPVYYENDNLFLGSYLGYFITIPSLFSFLDYSSINFLLFLYTFLGCYLGFLWFNVLCENVSVYILLFFVFIGGLDAAGFLYNFGLFSGIAKLFEEFFVNQPMWYNSTDSNFLLIYPSNTQVFYWGPQHAIPCWIASGMFFYEMTKENDTKRSPLYLSLLPFWSPFMLVGIVPYFLYSVFRTKFKGYFQWSNLVLIPVVLALYFFVSAVPVSDITKGFLFYKGERLLDYAGQLFSYSWFLFFEIGIWAIVVFSFNKFSLGKKDKQLFYLMLLTLVAIPLFKLGKYNDWTQRVSMPSLFLLWVYVFKTIFQLKRQSISKYVLILLLVISSWDSLFYVSKSIVNNGLGSNLPSADKIHRFPVTTIEMGWDKEQTLVYPYSYFYKTFLKELPKQKQP